MELNTNPKCMLKRPYGNKKQAQASQKLPVQRWVLQILGASLTFCLRSVLPIQLHSSLGYTGPQNPTAQRNQLLNQKHCSKPDKEI